MSAFVQYVGIILALMPNHPSEINSGTHGVFSIDEANLGKRNPSIFVSTLLSIFYFQDLDGDE